MSSQNDLIVIKADKVVLSLNGFMCRSSSKHERTISELEVKQQKTKQEPHVP